MARYTYTLNIATSLDRLQQQVTEVLTACNFEIIFLKDDYFIARERPGKIPFARLVTVEVLVDSTRATEDRIKLTFVAKNEELPLQNNNHCQQMHQELNHAISTYAGWTVVEETTQRDPAPPEQVQLIDPPDFSKPTSSTNAPKTNPPKSIPSTSNGRIAESTLFPKTVP